jgi:hypothetical protein
MTFMEHFFKIIQRFIREPKKTLGRWNIEHCQNKMNRKIDFSNEDHCGPCGSISRKIEKNEIILYSNIKHIHLLKLPITSKIANKIENCQVYK